MYNGKQNHKNRENKNIKIGMEDPLEPTLALCFSLLYPCSEALAIVAMPKLVRVNFPKLAK
jgi:hypothetical protein